MSHSVFVESWKSETLHQLPGGWSAKDYQALLELLDVSDVPAAEIRDYTLLALADLERPEAAKLVLNYVLAEMLTEGQISNAAHELQEEKLWEEYPDIALQKYFYLAAELLYEAFNGGFPQPKVHSIEVVLKPVAPTTAEDINAIEPAAMLRLLAPGFGEQTLMVRLFSDELETTAFPDAEGIIWHKTVRMMTPDTFELIIISSEYWLEGFSAPESFTSSFVVDEPEDEDE